MNKIAYLYGTKLVSQNVPTGALNRMNDINELLTEIGFETKRISKLPKSPPIIGAILVLVSFPSAKLLKKARKKFGFIWLDATDSWKLTRRQLWRFNIFIESLKYVRDLLYSRHYKKADLVTYCSARDLSYDNLSNSNALVLNHRFVKKVPTYSEHKRFVFVGHGGYPPNQKAVDFLLECFANESFGCTLHIYGEGYDKFRSTAEVIFEGLGSNEDIYMSCDVHLAPIWCGSGVKYKTLNALAHDLPVISSLEGANGFVFNELLHIAEGKVEFCNLMQTIPQVNKVNVSPKIASKSDILESDDILKIMKILRSLK